MLILLRVPSSSLVADVTLITILLLLLEPLRLLVRILLLLTTMIKIRRGKSTRRTLRSKVEPWRVLRTPTITTSV
jgi:hypothetical protein